MKKSCEEYWKSLKKNVDWGVFRVLCRMWLCIIMGREKGNGIRVIFEEQYQKGKKKKKDKYMLNIVELIISIFEEVYKYRC